MPQQMNALPGSGFLSLSLSLNRATYQCTPWRCSNSTLLCVWEAVNPALKEREGKKVTFKCPKSWMGKNSCWQPDESSTLHQNLRRKSKCETPSLRSYQNLADDYMERPLNDLPLLAKSLMRKYWLGRSWIERQRCLAALSFQQYAGNWIIKSTLMESWEYCGFSFFSPLPEQ